MNPALWLTRAARLTPRAPALLDGADTVADYEEFARRAAAIAGRLRERYGALPGDRVAIFMPNSVSYIELLYGIWFAGCVAVPINSKLHAREAAWMVSDSGARLVVTSGAKPPAPLACVECATVVSIDEFLGLDTATPGDPQQRNADDIAWLFYTSGTTGRPKGVMITNGNIAAMAMSYFVDVDSVGQRDAILYAAPISHGAGLYNFMFTIRGARHVVPRAETFDPLEIQALAERLDNLCFFAAPTMVRRLVASARQTGFSGAGIRTIVYGGGPMYLSDIKEAVATLGARFVQIYGQGESPMTICALSRDLIADRQGERWETRLGSVGRAHSCVEVRVADDSGQELPRGEIGEVLVRGPTVMKGYWNNPDATEAAIRDGWLWTGDLGEMDTDGFLTLRDRSKDLIISGGTNIYPREVEEVLTAHQSVLEAAVLGEADPEWGEIVVAVVALRQGHSADDDALDGHCVANIARFKRPKRYVYVHELPKNAYGKVLKTELRDLLGHHYPAHSPTSNEGR
ncbi:MAG: AMP-binding protein [Rhizobiaceae bacterium]|nr:MAG: AMP-binding protein [Rhizobiaceae bacterium]CAG1016070.1 long-chain acyl-CoA synthetase [Rhizobiaceae bacterium]